MAKNIDVVLVVDCSGSLRDEKDQMAGAINETIVALKTHPDLYGYNISLSLIAFDDNIREAETFRFKPITTIREKIAFGEFKYGTNPGPALKNITEKALERYKDWKDKMVPCAHPLIFFFTDGYPFHKDEAVRKKYETDYKIAAQYIKEREAERKLLIVGCAFGEEASIPNIKLLTSKPETILKITDRNIEKLKRFFREIILTTAVHTITQTEDQLPKVFKNFNEDV